MALPEEVAIITVFDQVSRGAAMSTWRRRDGHDACYIADVLEVLIWKAEGTLATVLHTNRVS